MTAATISVIVTNQIGQFSVKAWVMSCTLSMIGPIQIQSGY